ncbi:MAG: thioredoxin, partial [Planctomycetaceae bacterium]|nr:thioredoxin [Planctomycetaceae bacterium]
MSRRTSWNVWRRMNAALGTPFVLVALCAAASAQGVTVEQVLAYRPSQQEVECDSPTGDEIAKCELKVDQEGKGSAWVVYGPQGTIIRRFVDSDGNKVVDQFRYYLHGLEVFRDIDSNENRKIDQCMWFNTGGTRWGVDTNEDGRIDEWKRISAEEASREAIHAIAAGNMDSLNAVLVNAADLQTLKMSPDLSKQVLESVKDPAAQVREITAKSKVLKPGTKWVRFDTSMLMPNLIPTAIDKAGQDLVVYENVMAIVQNGEETGFVQIGEMVRIGDVWKLTGIPRPVEGDAMQVAAGGLLMQPSFGATADQTAPVGITPEVQALLEQLQKLDADAPGAGASLKAMERYNVARAKLLGDLATSATSPENQEMWLRQQVEGITAATLANAYPNGLLELKVIEKAVMQKSPQSALVPYVVFQRILAEYSTRSQSVKANEQEEFQSWWAQQLEGFVRAYPKAEDAPDALFQLA